MENLFVNYKTAKELKDKGFDELCLCCFVDEEGGFGSFCFTTDDVSEALDNCGSFKRNSDYKYSVCAPTWQQVIDWFREKHKMFIEIDQTEMEYNDNTYSLAYSYKIKNNRDETIYPTGIRYYTKDYYKNYCLAIESALKLI